MLKGANVCIHAVAAIHLSFVAYVHFSMNFPKELAPFIPDMGGKTKYLTFWGCALSATYYWIALLNDLISGCKNDENKFITRVRDFIFLSIIFPVTAVVVVMFWSLYAVDQELILPKRMEPYFPPWLNHSLHTAVFIYAILELCTEYHKPHSKRSHLLMIGTLAFVYVAWYHIIYFKTGLWVYPVLTHLNWIGRCTLAAGSIAMGIAFFFCGYSINNVVWRKRVQDKRKNKRK